jgi:hypothetical protein
LNHLYIFVVIDRRPILDIPDHRARDARLFVKQPRPGRRRRRLDLLAAATAASVEAAAAFVTAAAALAIARAAVLVLGPGAIRGLRDWAIVVTRHLQKKYFSYTLHLLVLYHHNAMKKPQLRYLS